MLRATRARLLCEIRKRGLEKKYDWLRQEKLREGAAQKKPWTPKPPKKKQTNYCGKITKVVALIAIMKDKRFFVI